MLSDVNSGGAGALIESKLGGVLLHVTNRDMGDMYVIRAVQCGGNPKVRMYASENTMPDVC
jgi:hypothetical protein